MSDKHTRSTPRGPTNATNLESDDSRGLLEQVQRALHTSPYRCIRELRVKLEPEGIVIDGSVPSYYMKQMAQEVVCQVPRAIDVRNRTTVIAESFEPTRS